MLRVAVILIVFVLVTVAVAPLQLVALGLKLPLRRHLPPFYHRFIAAILGLRVSVVGKPSPERPLLILANHVSWLDIVVIGTVMPVVFVAKQEVAHWPLFGWLARMQRTIFIDRERRHKTGAATQRIAEHLVGGDAVVLFAEGTSSDGNHVLPFRTALIGAMHHVIGGFAHVGAVNVQPLSLAYSAIGGIPAGRQFRPKLAWYGDMEMVPHLLDIVCTGATDVIVTFGDAVAYDMDADRKAIARRAEADVRRMTSLALREKPAAMRKR